MKKLLLLIGIPLLLIGCKAEQQAYDIDVECDTNNYNEGFAKEEEQGVVGIMCLDDNKTNYISFNIQCKSDTLNYVDPEVFCTTKDGKSVRITLTSKWTDEEAQEIMESL